MDQPNITEIDIRMAQVCLTCPIYSRARSEQKGAAYWSARTTAGGLCPSCQAYAHVYGQQEHEPRPARQAAL